MSTTAPTFDPFDVSVRRLVLKAATGIRTLTEPIDEDHPHGALPGFIDTASDRYAALWTAETALRQTGLPTREGTLLDATTYNELLLAYHVLSAVRVCASTMLSGEAGESVSEVRAEVGRRMEVEVAAGRGPVTSS